MKIIRIKPPNHNYCYGIYQFRSEGRVKGIGIRVPFTEIDIRLWWG